MVVCITITTPLIYLILPWGRNHCQSLLVPQTLTCTSVSRNKISRAQCFQWRSQTIQIWLISHWWLSLYLESLAVWLGRSDIMEIFLIVCLRVNHVLCYSSLIHGPSAFASLTVSNYSRRSLKSPTKRIRSKNYVKSHFYQECFFISCFKLSQEWISACTEQFPDGPHIGKHMVFSETAN